ncbi:ATP-dependent DNA helicase pif1 [Brachionus plicatilis]|uniref:ATP-dependent DNA helicase pif1 n=1 Tax=Brachionus plicatilis TaxID=10195 RepID=A0A3M7Q012_BRAPC|nr:ATP-dependent DNA helicase pif1 [Brachionus plicatilis]
MITLTHKRKKNEDRDVVPYNPELLMLWNGHVNLQYCTKRGIEQYLVKYISKVEPTFKGKEMKSESNQVKNYFDLLLLKLLHLFLVIICAIEHEIYVKNSKTKVPISRSDKLLFDEDRNKVVKRKNDIIIRTNFFDKTDGEIYFYQKLIYNISFRSVDELISKSNLTRTYKEECFIRNLIKRPDDSDPDIDYLTYSNLKDPINILDLCF